MVSPDRPTELSPHSSNLPAVERRGLDYGGFSFSLILNPAATIRPKVVILTIHEDPPYQVDTAMAGASSYITERRIHGDFIPIMTEMLAQLT